MPVVTGTGFFFVAIPEWNNSGARSANEKSRGEFRCRKKGERHPLPFVFLDAELLARSGLHAIASLAEFKRVFLAGEADACKRA